MSQRNVLRAELVGDDTITIGDITVSASAPVLALCRELAAAGHDPDRRLHVFRGATLCLVVKAIGAAAELEINSKGTDFVCHRAVRAAPPVRQSSRADVQQPKHVEVVP